MDVERHVEFDEVDEVVGRTIIGEANGLSDRCAHGRPFQVLDFLGDQAGAEPIIAVGVNVNP